jgi:hypothetical protein
MDTMLQVAIDKETVCLLTQYSLSYETIRGSVAERIDLVMKKLHRGRELANNAS